MLSSKEKKKSLEVDITETELLYELLKIDIRRTSFLQYVVLKIDIRGEFILQYEDLKIDIRGEFILRYKFLKIDIQGSGRKKAIIFVHFLGELISAWVESRHDDLNYQIIYFLPLLCVLFHA